MPDAPFLVLDPRLPAPHIVPSSLPDRDGEPDAPDSPEHPGELDDAGFPLDAFPEPARAWIRDTAATTGTGPDAVAFPFLAIAGAAIGAIHAPARRGRPVCLPGSVMGRIAPWRTVAAPSPGDGLSMAARCGAAAWAARDDRNHAGWLGAHPAVVRYDVAG